MTEVPKRGRPSKNSETSPVAAAPKRSKPHQIKRNVIKDADKPAYYEAINGGGNWLRVASKASIFHEETQRVREIRYCPQEHSAFTDEQSDKSNVEHVIFNNKSLFVTRDKPNLKAFMDLHPGNAANGGNVFRLHEAEAFSEKVVEDEFLIHDAISLIKTKSLEELLPLAMSLNLNINQKNIEIKRELVQQARRNPQKVLDTFGNPLVQARGTIRQGFDFQIVSDNKGAVVWHDTNKMILSVPVGQTAEEVLTRYSMTDAGASVLAEIERQLSEIA